MTLPVQGQLWVCGSAVALVQIVDQKRFQWNYYESGRDIQRGATQEKYHLNPYCTYLFPEEWV